MPNIIQLPSHVADLIAAGEVVERPASVVKELVENAIDAGSSAVAVEIRSGGMSLIRVTDNGCGIAPSELPTAFLRHATSKLRTEADLGKIGTLGFRGEALAAISSVSRLDMETRQRDTDSGASLHLEGGVPGEVLPAGVPEGTTIRVNDLFFNTPARLKFMKKDSAEASAVNGLMQHLALSHPDVSFKFIKDGDELLHTPGDGKMESAVYASLGREFAKSLLAVNGRGGDIVVDGFVTRPLAGRGSRSMQVFFVNGRFIKSQLLTAALEEGYRNQLMKGKFPGCVLSITMPVTAVDVNVHPAKTQVKFAREREVFDAVYHTVLDALNADGIVKPAASKPAEVVNPRQDFFQTMDAKTYREQAPKAEKAAPAQHTQRQPAWNTEWKRPEKIADVQKAAAFYQTSAPAPVKKEVPPAAKAAVEAKPLPAAHPAEAPAVKAAEPPAEPPKKAYPPAIPAMKQQALDLPQQETMASPGETPWRIAGEVLRTYIICEAESGDLYLIDKHAAHERINFDRLQKAQTPPCSQQLLSPAAVQLSHEDAALLLENLALLEQFGFACEDFGGDTILVRAVPTDIDAADTIPTLEEFAQKLRTGRSPAEKRENLLHTMACKAAIKAGMHSDELELRVLVDRVQSGEIKYCPHGRPVAVKITKYELEKMFKRVT
ncbi:MAG: DNA mismatch repair endonuclease MutL [Oscillibacter sp.]|jgi:DNA mismatch repair protein MutL|nr:DNA mismatch repair endonuclease MutL [Oscillibacter sp.]